MSQHFPTRRPCSVQMKHRLLVTSATLGGVLAFGSVAHAAGSGYVPTSGTVPAGTPGGFTQVVAAQSISPTTTTTTTVAATVDNSPVKVVVPPGAFSTPVQVIVTAPVLSQISSAISSLGFSPYTAVAGVGVNVVTASGQLYSGSFLKPMTVSVSNSLIASGDKVVEWNAHGAFSTLSAPTISPGQASWTFQSDPAFAVLAPKSSVVPSATSPVTGKPFVRDGALGAVLMGAGMALVYRRRRSNRNT